MLLTVNMFRHPTLIEQGLYFVFGFCSFGLRGFKSQSTAIFSMYSIYYNQFASRVSLMLNCRCNDICYLVYLCSGFLF